MANLTSLNLNGNFVKNEGTVTTQSGTTVVIDLETGTNFEVSMDNISGPITTFTINMLSGWPAGYISSFILQCTQASTSRDFAWAALTAIKWPGGGAGAPTMTGTDNKIDIYSFTSWDDGSTWYGKIIGQNF